MGLGGGGLPKVTQMVQPRVEPGVSDPMTLCLAAPAVPGLYIPSFLKTLTCVLTKLGLPCVSGAELTAGHSSDLVFACVHHTLSRGAWVPEPQVGPTWNYLQPAKHSQPSKRARGPHPPTLRQNQSRLWALTDLLHFSTLETRSQNLDAALERLPGLR